MEYQFLDQEKLPHLFWILPDTSQKFRVAALQDQYGTPTELLFEQQPQEQNVYSQKMSY